MTLQRLITRGQRRKEGRCAVTRGWAKGGPTAQFPDPSVAGPRARSTAYVSGPPSLGSRADWVLILVLTLLSEHGVSSLFELVLLIHWHRPSLDSNGLSPYRLDKPHRGFGALIESGEAM